jgi:hypothetical protein
MQKPEVEEIPSGEEEEGQGNDKGNNVQCPGDKRKYIE